MYYPVVLAPDDNDTILVTFPDVPEAITYGEDEFDALDRAVDALETALSVYIQERRESAAAERSGRRTDGRSPEPARRT
jgi:antitoxin HicB